MGITISALTYLMDDQRRVVEAKAYPIFQINSTHVCKVEYIGPKYFTVEKNDSRVCDLFPEEVEDGNIPVPPSGHCEHSLPTESAQYRKITRCFGKNETIPPIRDIRYINGAFHIQCFGYNITINGVQQPCPPHVFSVSDRVSFGVADRSHVMYQHRIDKQVGLSQDWTSILNLKLPAVPSIEIPVLPKVNPLRLPSDVFKYMSDQISDNKRNAFFWIGVISSSMILVLTLYLCCLRISFRVQKPRIANAVVFRRLIREPQVIQLVSERERNAEQQPFSLIDLN